jgi:hypothetical protein
MKRLVLTALIISVTAGIAFAQLGVLGGWVSPQNTATVGRIRSIADDFIRPDAYVNVKFDKFFGMTSYDDTTKLNLGYATQAGSLYIGAYYGGTFLAGIPNITYTERKRTWLNTLDKSGVKSYDALPTLGGNVPNNIISILIGVADMGFRASLSTNKRMFSDSNFVVNVLPNEYYKSYEIETGNFAPQFAWSMAKNLTSIGVKPYVVLDMTFTRNYTYTNQYDFDGSDWAAKDENVSVSDINNLIRIRTGLGGITLVNKDGFRFSVDLDYDLRLTSYDNSYTYINADSDNKIKTGFKGTITNPGTPTAFLETSLSRHVITPSVSGQWSGAPFAFRFKISLPVDLQSNEYTEKDFKAGATDGSLVKDGDDYKTTIFGIQPNIALAAQWRIIPKLALNLGGSIDLGSVGSTTKEGKSYFNNKALDNSSFKTVTNQYPTSITNTLVSGVTFNLTDNVTFEAASGATSTIDTFGTGANTGTGKDSLFYFTKLLVSLRY